MSKDLKSIKQKLTIIFTAIVFTILILTCIFFFSFRYFKFLNDDTSSFNRILFGLNSKTLTVNQFIMNGERIDNNFRGRGKDNIPSEDEFAGDNELSNDFLNVIHLDRFNNELNVIIRDDISSLDYEYILNSPDLLNKATIDGFLVNRVNLENGEKVILIKVLRYSMSDYIKDIVGFLVVILLFSIGLYYIGRKFINKVMIPVEENISDMKDFVHNAGHELKTPLSVMDSNLQLLDSLKVYDQSMNKELKNEVVKLNSIIDGLISLSDINSFNEKENINILEIIEDIISSYHINIENKDITIRLKIPKTSTVSTNKNNIYIVLSNIIGNAIKYNKDGGKINISYKLGELIVKDTGIGITKDNIDKIFNRFFKEDRSRTSEGFGIGLALVKKITTLYSWKINVESAVGKGTTFKINF